MISVSPVNIILRRERRSSLQSSSYFRVKADKAVTYMHIITCILPSGAGEQRYQG